MPVAPQPLLVVDDVVRSRDWWNALLGGDGPDPDHADAEHGYARVLVDGELVLQVHHSGVDHHHGRLVDPDVPRGNGVLVWFGVTAFDEAVARARDLGAEVVADVHHNPNADQRELWLRDPDGYVAVLAEA